MSVSFLFLLLLVVTAALSPALDESFVHGVAGVMAAGALGIVAYTVPGRMRELVHLRRPLAVIVLMGGLPAAWMLLQILPLGSVGLAHPIWESTQSALGRRVAGTITIDIGATIVAFSRYLAAGAILLVAACETVERRQAAWVFYSLMGVATFFAVGVLLQRWAGVSFLGSLEDKAAAGLAASFGTILAATEAMRLVNRHGRRSAKRDAERQLVLRLVPSLVAFALCGAAVVSLDMWQDALAAICGLAILAVVLAGRRFNFAPWQCIGSAAIIVILAVTLAAGRNELATSDPILALGSAPPAQVAIAERMIRDSPWFGSGAGTYGAVLPVYRAADEIIGATAAPTAAAAIAVELGRPALGVVVIMVIAMVAWLLRAALLRGRDSSYPAATAAWLVALTVQSFSNASLSALSTQILTAVLVGLALAQSESRSDTR